jgi:hypothetical protein
MCSLKVEIKYDLKPVVLANTKLKIYKRNNIQAFFRTI